MIRTLAHPEDDRKQRLVDHIAKTAVGARLADIANFVATAEPWRLAQLEAEMRIEQQATPMHTFDYDAFGG